MANVKVKQIKCPCCGSSLSLKDEGYGEIKCSYCNAIVFVSRDETNDGNITVYNEGDNKPLANISIPLGWDIANTFVDYNRATLQMPYTFGFDLVNNMGASIHIESGATYYIQGPIAYKNEQLPYTIQKEFEDVGHFIDELACEYAKIENKKIKFLEDLDVPVEKYDRVKEFEKTKQFYENDARNEEVKTGGKMNIFGIYGDSACKSYEVGDQVLLIYTRVIARLAGLGGVPNVAQGISNLVSGIGNLLNSDTANNIRNKMADTGLFGGMITKKPQEEKKVEEPKKEETSPVLVGTINHPGQFQFLDWRVNPVFSLITNKDDYKKIYKKAFKQVCSSFEISPQVLSEWDNMKAQMEASINQRNQMQAQAQYQHGQALINMGAQRMAANQSYVNSMMQRSNNQYQAQRDSYNSRMQAQDRMRDKRTEAILGVNTFIKPDGKEVEVSVSADTAWINGKGEIIGGSAGFNPGSGWTQMDKKN